MARVSVRELKDGDSVNEIFLLADRQLRSNRNGNLYLLASLRDRSGIISGLMWNVTEESANDISTGDYVRVRGKVQLFQGSLQMILMAIDTVPDTAINEEDFQMQPVQEAAPMLARLREFVESVESEDLRAIGLSVLGSETLLHRLCAAPAGVKAHHAYMGGLLEHVVSMTELADRISAVYSDLSRDLLLLGVLFHDIGKTRELGWDPGLVYTDEGQLLGHIHLGMEILADCIKLAESELGRPIDAEQVLRLKHMLISHHGTREYGSPVIPMTPEALTLNSIDALDSKMHEFTRTISEDVNQDSSWTPYHPRLERRLFKGLQDN
jgi:3'-5' exoribonuclease